MFNCKVHGILKRTLRSSFLIGKVWKNNKKLLKYLRVLVKFQSFTIIIFLMFVDFFFPSDQAPPIFNVNLSKNLW